MLTYNNKLVHSSTEFALKEARKQEHDLMVYISMKMSAKRNNTYPDIHIGDTVNNNQPYSIKCTLLNGQKGFTTLVPHRNIIDYFLKSKMGDLYSVQMIGQDFVWRTDERTKEEEVEELCTSLT